MFKNEKVTDEVHEMRRKAQIYALIEEVLLHSELNECNHDFDDLYDLASNEFFTLDEKKQIKKEAIIELENKFNIKVMKMKPLVLKTI